jgi:hypothetical protein
MRGAQRYDRAARRVSGVRKGGSMMMAGGMDQAAALANAGQLAMQSGQYEHAAQCFYQAIQLAPGVDGLYYHYATACLWRGFPQDALASLDRCMALGGPWFQHAAQMAGQVRLQMQLPPPPMPQVALGTMSGPSLPMGALGAGMTLSASGGGAMATGGMGGALMGRGPQLPNAGGMSGAGMSGGGMSGAMGAGGGMGSGGMGGMGMGGTGMGMGATGMGGTGMHSAGTGQAMAAGSMPSMPAQSAAPALPFAGAAGAATPTASVLNIIAKAVGAAVESGALQAVVKQITK